MTVAENIGFGLQVKWATRARRAARVDELLGLMGLTGPLGIHSALPPGWRRVRRTQDRDRGIAQRRRRGAFGCGAGRRARPGQQEPNQQQMAMALTQRQGYLSILVGAWRRRLRPRRSWPPPADGAQVAEAGVSEGGQVCISRHRGDTRWQGYEGDCRRRTHPGWECAGHDVHGDDFARVNSRATSRVPTGARCYRRRIGRQVQSRLRPLDGARIKFVRCLNTQCGCALSIRAWGWVQAAVRHRRAPGEKGLPSHFLVEDKKTETEPELTPTALRHVAAQRWKRVIGDETAVETGATLAISRSGPDFPAFPCRGAGHGLRGSGGCRGLGVGGAPEVCASPVGGGAQSTFGGLRKTGAASA